MLGATFFLLLSGYLRVLDPGVGAFEVVGTAVLTLVLGGALFAWLGLVVLSCVDFFRTNPDDRFLGFLLLIVGALVFDAMQILAETDRSAYLQTFVATMATIVVAAVVWAKRRIEPKKATRRRRTPTSPRRRAPRAAG